MAHRSRFPKRVSDRHAGGIRRWRAVWGLALSACLSGADAGDSRNPPGVRVSMAGETGGMIVLEANEAPLTGILDEMARSTGIRIHYPVLPKGPVTAGCRGATLMEVMACLLGPDADLMIRYSDHAGNPARSRRPAELWVLGTSFTGVDPGASFGNSRRATAASGKETIPVRPMDAEGTNGIAARSESAGAETPAQRAQVLSRLIAESNRDDPALRQALEQGLSDAAGEVRAQAVHGLASLGGAEAGALLLASLHDSDSDVRLMVVDSVGSDPAGLELLRLAVADSDETVRMLAAMKLEASSDSRRVP